MCHTCDTDNGQAPTIIYSDVRILCAPTLPLATLLSCSRHRCTARIDLVANTRAQCVHAYFFGANAPLTAFACERACKRAIANMTNQIDSEWYCEQWCSRKWCSHMRRMSFMQPRVHLHETGGRLTKRTVSTLNAVDTNMPIRVLLQSY
jgi:hypothetical protein